MTDDTKGPWVDPPPFGPADQPRKLLGTPEPQIAATDASPILADILDLAAKLDQAAHQALKSNYEPDEPRDVKMAAQLMAQFKTEPAPDGWTSAAALTGVPVEEIARQVNLQWLQQVADVIARMRIESVNPLFGDNADWSIVCSDHLFENWAAIDGVELIHHAELPPWTVYVVRSTKWWERNWTTAPSSVPPINLN